MIEGASIQEGLTLRDASGVLAFPERRKGRRRRLPFVRSAVLEVDGRSHIATLIDLSPDGAFLSTSVRPTLLQDLRLRVVLPRDGREVELPCELVWCNERFDATTDRPAGVAVRFLEANDAARRRLEEFAETGMRPVGEPAPAAHFEYRVLESPSLNVAELNRLGLDGWELRAAVPKPGGVYLVLMRRL
jgi:hypothetical protein